MREEAAHGRLTLSTPNFTGNDLNYSEKKFHVAPMLDWTDRHCRVFHRTLSRSAVLYTEMVTARAVKHGNRDKLLGFSPVEQPVVLQLGGSEPAILAEAAKIGEDWGYSAINLNCGCPSDRVQGGNFGACLMAAPALVAEGFAAMRAAVKIPVTIKCRIGIDDQDEEQALEDFVSALAAAGCRDFIVHARKAWLKGLSPKENREIPPLNYGRVQRLKAAWPHLNITLNGGLAALAHDMSHLSTLDGVMYGREAYHNPWMLTGVDPLFAGAPAPVSTRRQAVEALLPYMQDHVAAGLPLHHITRHMLGLYHAEAGGRLWRHVLSTDGQRHGAGLEVINHALAVVEEEARRQAEDRATSRAWKSAQAAATVV
ncbi:MAG: tRNA dihydrouridine(20/20a) synthase DusA [Hyphomicrobiales bacterium]